MTKIWKIVPTTHRRCARCGKVFSGRAALMQHLRDKHGLDPAIHHFQPVRRVDREPSIAEQLVDATIHGAAGDPVDPAIETMFPDEIATARRHGT